MEPNSGKLDRLVVAIDGPAAAGKSTVGEAVAHRLNALYFDTGVIYRALTLAALERGIDVVGNTSRLLDLARGLNVRVAEPSQQDGRLYDVWLNGRDVSWAIRSADVDRAVSPVAAHPAIRRALLPLQREIGGRGRVVMTGRDIGTVVMPDAELKIWLDASLEERARRRQRELAGRGIDRSLSEVQAEMAERDRRDSQRTVAPMRPAEDAVLIQTDGRTVTEIVEEIATLAGSQTKMRHQYGDQ
ncbi:(d)CMP kinase [Nitrolancea hollandica]|uniref:Cytidylate kinase n=1 Tax=Nitrolancea hollandica Lb TaxID=1129897 RepID=I4EG55_9BACT|nr:(d)CMP kinase [Nitrolancea hollandica]CCF83667.1 Cytidylate kinase [Nitrolancea hollandica Lb]